MVILNITGRYHVKIQDSSQEKPVGNLDYTIQSKPLDNDENKRT